MTTLNAAPTAASAAHTGTAGAAAVPVKVPQATPVPLPFPPAPRGDPGKGHEAQAPDLHLPGSGVGATPGATAVMARQSSVTVPLDAFAKQSGPDAAVQTAAGVVSVHAVFQLDAKTRELSVAIVSEDGQLIRLIPPESVARMIAAMATYRGR
jgi:FlaG protein